MAWQLETTRLNLHPFQNADCEAFARYRSEPDVAKYQSWDTPFSPEEAVQFIEAMKSRRPGSPGEWYQVALERKMDGVLIGDCAFHIFADDARQAEIGVTLAGRFQGQGYATEALTRLLDFLFGECGLHRIQATCDAENLASAALLARIGMRREAHFIENIWFKGAWGSEFRYAVLRREWESRRRNTAPPEIHG